MKDLKRNRVHYHVVAKPKCGKEEEKKKKEIDSQHKMKRFKLGKTACKMMNRSNGL